jgi:hypothetical protein
MAYEASEIMFAAALLYTNRELEKYSEDLSLLRDLMVDAKNKIQTTSIVKFGNSSIEKGFLDLMDEHDPNYLKDLVGGISAVYGLRTETGDFSIPKSIYMTGNVWPSEVEKFRVKAFGFEDYNSADVIVSPKKSHFYGISLKKKRKAAAGEPTLINKAFDTILSGNGFEAVKQRLTKIRTDYFSSLVIEAVDIGIIRKQDISNFDQLTKTEAGRKELFEAKKRDKKLFDRAYIDTKGSARALKGYKDENTTDKNSMRYFVNKKLSEPNNELWSEFVDVMNDYADLFAESLINIILKTKLYEELTYKDIKENSFNFYLVTAVGDVSSKGVVDIGKATILPLKTTLCGLNRIETKNKNVNYKIVLNSAKKSESSAAKIFLQLKRGTTTILDLEIRYKGAFTPQPQFQATLNDQFKQLLIKECGLT